MTKHSRKKHQEKEQSSALSSAEAKVINDALDLLYCGMREANQHFQTDNEYAGRTGVILALWQALEFFSTLKPIVDEGLNAPLVRLLGALLNLKDGSVEPLLKSAKSPTGRRISGAWHNGLKGATVYTVHCFIKTGLKGPDAHKQIAEILEHAGVIPARGKGTITARTIRNWCESLSVDVGCHSEAAQTYRTLERNFPYSSFSAEPPDKIRQIFRQRLTDTICRTRGQEAT